jgi:hypothetical protein
LRYAPAIANLLEVQKIRRGRHFGPWHALGLAYAYQMRGNLKESDKWLDAVRRNGKEDIDLKFFEGLYPEMAASIRQMART